MSSSKYAITRKIEIDMAHRIPEHASKCRNLHGHRYIIEAECISQRLGDSAQDGMVIDFGFLKDLMIKHIHDIHDHGLTISVKDSLLMKSLIAPHIEDEVRSEVGIFGYYHGNGIGGLKICVMKDVPTAENLAAFWFNTLSNAVLLTTDTRVELSKITVWETPNCKAVYPVI